MTTTPFRVVTTIADNVKNIPITDGYIIFVRDKGRIAMDFKGQRTFYNQITELESEFDRQNLANPLDGYYFIIETAIFWRVKNQVWQQLTSTPEEYVFIGTEMPELGKEKTLYVNKETKEVSIWDTVTSSYTVVADKTQEHSGDLIDLQINTITHNHIDSLF